MGTQHAQRVVVKRNTGTEDTCKIHRELVHKISGLYNHAQQCSLIKCMCMSKYLSVCVPSVSTGLLYATLCHYDDVQVHVCNNASVCTSVSKHERMHVHALCVSCKEITTRQS